VAGVYKKKQSSCANGEKTDEPEGTDEDDPQ
jgi:hypothetical protein